MGLIFVKVQVVSKVDGVVELSADDSCDGRISRCRPLVAWNSSLPALLGISSLKRIHIHASAANAANDEEKQSKEPVKETE